MKGKRHLSFTVCREVLMPRLPAGEPIKWPPCGSGWALLTAHHRLGSSGLRGHPARVEHEVDISEKVATLFRRQSPACSLGQSGPAADWGGVGVDGKLLTSFFVFFDSSDNAVTVMQSRIVIVGPIFRSSSRLRFISTEGYS